MVLIVPHLKTVCNPHLQRLHIKKPEVPMVPYLENACNPPPVPTAHYLETFCNPPVPTNPFLETGGSNGSLFRN